MPPPRIPISHLLSHLRILRSSFPYPRIYKPRDPRDPNGRRTLTNIGILARTAQVFLVGHFVTKYIIEIQTTEGISMMPTIPHSYRSVYPRILISKFHRYGRDVKVGDVVSFSHPMVDRALAAKRIVGMPGDYVSVISPGKRGDDLNEEHMVKSVIQEEMFQVPEGHCWLVGDNLEWSRDSRMFGPVPLALINGKVLAVISPWSDMKWLEGAVTDATPDEPGPIIVR